MSWARSRAPSLDMALFACVFTVNGDTNISAAIWALSRPTGQTKRSTADAVVADLRATHDHNARPVNDLADRVVVGGTGVISED